MPEYEWPFLRYPKILGSTSSWELSKREWQRLTRLTWCATEKIDGANLCLASNGIEVRAAKRTRWLRVDESFFAHAMIQLKYEEALLSLHRDVCQGDSKLLVFVYGELYGGCYGSERSEVGVPSPTYYSPMIEFTAFDVAIVTASGEQEFLAFDSAKAASEASGLPFAEPIVVGDWKSINLVETRFKSTIHRRFRLPEIASNFAEGLVIRPIPETSVMTPKGPRRALIKRRLADIEQQSKSSSPRPNEATWALYDLDSITAMAVNLTDSARLASAISKVGLPETNELMAELINEIERDVWADLISDIHTDLIRLSRDDRQRIRSTVRDHARELVGPHRKKPLGL